MTPAEGIQPESTDPQPGVLPRRSFLFLSMLAVASCAGPKSQQIVQVPEPIWPEIPRPLPALPAAPAGSATPVAKSAPTSTSGQPSAETLRKGPVPFALARKTWAKGAPVASRLVPMLPPRWITVHHEGWTPFYGTSDADTRARLDQVRNGHLGRDWGDVGYHFIIDRSGRVWEGRYLKYQGAHVEHCNENNVGVMCLGNFMQQEPTPAQLVSLQKTVTALRTYYRVPASRVRSHREWPSARTDCPGTKLQTHMAALRRGELAG